MKISKNCEKCLYDRQLKMTDNAEYLAEIKALLDGRHENDSSPYIVYLFNKVHKKYFGEPEDMRAIKKQYNDLVLGMQDDLRRQIESAPDPLAEALMIARIGNYIDFAAMNHVDKDEFLALFGDTQMRTDDARTYESFVWQCEEANDLLLICDNCGEIVLDKLLAEQLKKRFPQLTIKAMVRGGEVLNDATVEDALYCGLDKAAQVISNGEAITGTVYEMLSGEAKKALDEADVVLAKGQGNYESMSGTGRHVFSHSCASASCSRGGSMCLG